MATGNTQINNSDPAILRQLERQTATTLIRPAAVPGTVPASGNITTTAGAVRNLAPVISGNDTVFPQSTTATSNNSVTVTSSINNDSGDITTVYATNGAITVNPVNQTINQYTAVDSGVSQILAGSGITVSSTGNSGTGVVTVSSSTTLGNITSVNLDGNISNVLRGDGTWGADANSSYGNSNVAAYLPTYTGNVGAGNVNVTGTVYANGISSTGLASLTTLNVSATANLGAVGNVKITGGTSGQKLTTDGAGNLSWTNDANSSYGDSNVVTLLSAFGSNTITTTGNVSVGNIIGNGQALTNIAGANVSGTVGNANLSQYLDVSDVNNNFSYHVVLSAGSGDKSLHIDADDNLQYNPSDGTLTATRVDATYVLADLQYSNGYPAANVTGLGNIATINLDGNASNVLRGDGTFSADANSSYGDSNVVSLLAAFGSNTISTTGIITADGANLSNVPYANLTGAPSLGNISSINLDGNVSNLLTGNGTYVAIPTVPTVGNIATLNLDGNVSNLLTGNGTYVAIPTVPTVGNIATLNLDGNSQTWLAGNGVFANIAIPSVGNIATLNLDGSSSNVLYGNGVFAAVSGGSYGDSNVSTLLGSFGSNSISTAGNVTANNFSGNTNGFTIGYLDVPQVSASNTTLALGDAGKHYYSTTAGNLTLTVPLNSSVAFATGTAISIVVQAAGNLLVNAASGVTLYMAGNSSAANRVVGGYGMATLLKVASDTWFINGTGVS